MVISLSLFLLIPRLDYAYDSNTDSYYVKYAWGNSEQYTIKDYINGKPVTKIGDRAFYQKDKLVTINIINKDNLKDIGRLAFSGCKNLENIDLSNLDDVKSALITELSMSKPSVVGIILGSVKWKLEGEKLSFAVKSEHHLVQLKSNSVMLKDIVSKIYNRNISLEFFVEEEVTEVKQVELPSSVKLIKDAFNGSVLGWN